jgi:hypothetical protein
MKVLISRLSVVLRADKLVGLNGARSSSKNAKAGSVVPMRSARIDETGRCSSSIVLTSNSATMRILDPIDRCYDVGIPREYATERRRNHEQQRKQTHDNRRWHSSRQR